MPPIALSLEETWENYYPGLKKMFAHSGAGGQSGKIMTHADYMRHYTTVYNYCTSSSSNSSKRGTLEVNSENNDIAGLDFYKKIRSFLEGYCVERLEELKPKSGAELLALYNERWTDYLFSRKVMSNNCMYINRHCVTRAQEKETGGEKIYNLAQLAIAVWRTELFTPLEAKIRAALLDLIEHDRNGEPIKSNLIRTCVNCLSTLGLHDSVPSSNMVVDQQPQGQDLSIYIDYFEEEFLKETTKYYENESKQYLAENAVTDYMKQVEKRVAEEDQRVSKYLHDSTRAKLSQCIYKVLIQDYLELFNSEVKILFQNERHGDLHRMFKLLSNVANGVTNLKQRLEEHVGAQGQSAIEACGEISTSGEDAKRYVETLLEVHKKYAALVHTSFQDDVNFVESLDKACRGFVNNNAVTKKSKASRSPELLAKYCDSLLKKSSKNPEEDQLEGIFTEIMVIFRYIEDKDVFEKFYKKLLGNRLVNKRSVSDDAESSMISKLKAQCGHEYTSKLQRMFTDMENSKSLNSKFRDHLTKSNSKLGLDFNVQVLTMNSWPFSVVYTINLPSVLVRCLDRFTTFYTNEHEGRKLKWLHHLCKGELTTLYTKKQHFLEANTIQMAALLQFNEYSTQDMTSLCEGTGLKEKIIEPHLQNLVKMRILQLTDGKYSCNEKYNHKKVRVKIDVPVKMEQRAEADETHKAAEEDRKFVLQATIVRIMKTRKKLNYKLLVQEVIEQVKNRFKPKVPNIKRNIDSLIEQEYLRRQDGAHNELEYLA